MYHTLGVFMMFHIFTLDIFMRRHFNRILQNTGGWTLYWILRWILTLPLMGDDLVKVANEQNRTEQSSVILVGRDELGSCVKYV